MKTVTAITLNLFFLLLLSST